MTLDYRTMAPADWIPLGIIIALCLLICWALLFKPSIPWRSIQRYRDPNGTEETLGEPTKKFITGCRLAAVIVILLVLVCIISPFVPALRGL